MFKKIGQAITDFVSAVYKDQELNPAQKLMLSWTGEKSPESLNPAYAGTIQELREIFEPAHYYKAPHAPRGTPKKLHLRDRQKERKEAQELYRKGLQKPQPDKYKNASRCV